MPPRRRKPKVRARSSGSAGMGGTNSGSAMVSAGRATEYVRDGAAQLVFPRDLPRASDTHGNDEGGTGEGRNKVADAAGAVEDSDNTDLECDVDTEPELSSSPKTGLTANRRDRQAENWQRAEEIFADVMLKDRLADPCNCTQDDVVTVRRIDLDSYTQSEFHHCNCPRSSSCLLKEGYFPCAPIKAKTAFSIRLLRLLHYQSALGHVSRSAWSGGLRAVFESEKKAILPAFDKELGDAYDHWLAVKSRVDTMVAGWLERQNGGT